MSLVINHNSMSANVARNLNSHYAKLGTSTQRLSTGQRINSAADDAAGLAIRELQRSDIAALHQGARNANDAISLIQVADGSLSVIDEKLIRMRELAEQAATGTYSSTQRLMIESEYQQMASEITRIANATDFNGIKLLDGTLSGTHDGSNMESKGALKVHFGTGNDSAEDYYYITIGNCTAEALGVGSNAFEWTTPVELTKEYYEKLRDDSAQKVYDKTYTQKYTEYYKEIYDKLVTGTPPDAGIPADEAAVQAEAEAKANAEKAADLDRKMFMATTDKIYEDNFFPTYQEAYLAGRDEGLSHKEADEAATRAGLEAAIRKVRDTFDTVVNDGTIDAMTGASRTDEGAQALFDLAESSARDAIYNDLYNSLYTEAAAAAVTANGNNPLNASQTNELREKVAERVLAEEAAIEAFAKQVRAGLEERYKEGGWTALQQALSDAENNSTPFSQAVDKIMNETAYRAMFANVPAFTIQDAAGTGTIATTALTDVNANATIGGIYQQVGRDSDVLVDDMPPRNREGADLLIEKIGQEAYDAVYETVYKDVSSKLTDQVRIELAAAQQPPVTPPTNFHLDADHVLAIHNIADEMARTQAENLGGKLKVGFQQVYSTGYNGDGQLTGFQAYYTEYLQAGDPRDVAEKKAEARASADGWAAMKRQLEEAENGTTLGVVEFWTGGPSVRIDPSAPTEDLQNVEITAGTELRKADGTLVYTLQNDVNVLAADEAEATTLAIGIYNALGKAGNTYLDVDHGLIGDPKNVVEGGAAYYVETFEDEAVSRQVPTKGNNLLTQENAQHAITAINDAIEAKDKIRAHLGALQNRFENTITNLNIQAENLQNAESRISDVDVATEMTEFVRQQILTQTAVAMLAQANSLPQMASQLIGG